jgi:beta-lactamase class A
MKQKFLIFVVTFFHLLASACTHPPVETSPVVPPTAAQTPTTIPISQPLGVLTEQQRSRLSTSALAYVAETETAAIQVSRSIGYLPSDGHPASVCGPLSIAILQDAGLLESAVDRHDFWKLNPRPDMDLPLLQQTFPPERYLWFSTHTSINEFAFQDYPLYPGDFLYIYAGPGGSFEHMLVVSRVDDAGRAFSVTNLNTPSGYLIQEKLLYDPSRPEVGIFYDWTNSANWKIGLTGFGGFDLWRLKSTPQEPDPQEKSLADDLESIFSIAGGEWAVMLKEASGPVYYERLAFTRIHPASTIKVPLAMVYLNTLEKRGVTGLQEYLQTHTLWNIGLSELLSSMLVTSDEDAADLILQETVANVNYLNVLSSWGITHTWFAPRRSTATDMVSLLEGLYSGKMASPQSRSIILALLSTYSPNDETRLGGELTRLMEEDGKIYNKRGTITSGLLVVGEVAIMEYHAHVYLLAIYARPHQDGDTTYEKLDAAFPQVADALWKFMQINP